MIAIACSFNRQCLCSWGTMHQT